MTTPLITPRTRLSGGYDSLNSFAIVKGPGGAAGFLDGDGRGGAFAGRRRLGGGVLGGGSFGGGGLGVGGPVLRRLLRRLRSRVRGGVRIRGGVALVALEIQHLKWIVWEHWECRKCHVKHRECGHGARFMT